MVPQGVHCTSNDLTATPDRFRGLLTIAALMTGAHSVATVFSAALGEAANATHRNRPWPKKN
jgi:hypothetical protein